MAPASDVLTKQHTQADPVNNLPIMTSLLTWLQDTPPRQLQTWMETLCFAVAPHPRSDVGASMTEQQEGIRIEARTTTVRMSAQHVRAQAAPPSRDWSYTF
jgi:hypothetical protein